MQSLKYDVNRLHYKLLDQNETCIESSMYSNWPFYHIHIYEYIIKRIANWITEAPFSCLKCLWHSKTSLISPTLPSKKNTKYKINNNININDKFNIEQAQLPVLNIWNMYLDVARYCYLIWKWFTGLQRVLPKFLL